MKSLLSTSLLSALLLPAAWALAQSTAPQQPPPPASPQPPAPAQQQPAPPQIARMYELSLAALRPGRDTLAAALKRYNQKYSDSAGPEANVKRWRDPCTNRALSLELDNRSVIQVITVSSLVPQDGKCTDRRFGSLAVQDWITGRGLHLGDNQDKIVELYGEPASTGPSVNGDRELNFLYYAFDWAGSDVPQVMEIYCARETGRVVEITLAFPSL